MKTDPIWIDQAVNATTKTSAPLSYGEGAGLSCDVRPMIMCYKFLQTPVKIWIKIFTANFRDVKVLSQIVRTIVQKLADFLHRDIIVNGSFHMSPVALLILEAPSTGRMIEHLVWSSLILHFNKTLTASWSTSIYHIFVTKNWNLGLFGKEFRSLQEWWVTIRISRL